MDGKSIEMLEFNRVREILAGHTDFAVSRDLALGIQPSSDPDLVSLRLRQSAEARHLLSLEPNFSIGEIQDIRETAGMAARGKVLEPQTLLTIQSTLAAARHARSTVSKHSDECPSLWHIAKEIVLLPELEQEIDDCVDEMGQAPDYASMKLAELRHQLRETRQQLMDRLESFLNSRKGQRVAQESLITERESRYVIPVKAELQNEIEGIIHDVSNTGATVFMEPWITVGLGNELRQLEMEEKHEVERILAALSEEIGSNQTSLSQNIDLIALLDLTLAKARYADRARAAEPAILSPNSSGEQQPLKLVNAKHPLLKHKAVPLTVELGRDFLSLVITGPNAGGKTVALKTIGLMTLMAQAGLPIPAETESSIPIFDGVFADIGDEQSIEETISSFSWHMNNVVRIVQSATQNSLVLLDELGTSTDPSEGAALARSVLLHFLSKRIITVATTHYSELKVFAHSTEGLQNASLDFDPATLSPTYHLTMGIPGGSNALATASRLGLPFDIVDNARQMLGKGTQEMEKLLSDLNAEKQRVEELRSKLEKERSEAEILKKEWEQELNNVKNERQRILQEARDQVASEAAELQRQIRQANAELKKAKSRESIDTAKKTLETVHQQMKSPAWQTGTTEGEEETEPTEDTISVGDEVEIMDTHARGTVLSLLEKTGEVEVQVGQIKLKTNVNELKKVNPGGEVVPPRSPSVKKHVRGRKSLAELDLRGKRAEDIEPELDRYLNDASLTGFGEVSIIHGYGTGTVRQIVRETLASHPLVKSYRPGKPDEGSDGVTIASL
uniref:Endonuclease MutS2 n=1 Tax=bacterium enrichment culture clone fosmid MGS-K1 TaxID=1549356 RepID=A0A0B5KNT1_9BACT|nr:MutS2 family protein [bacterium enrichment culture clone fosmid MGS-K1]